MQINALALSHISGKYVEGALDWLEAENRRIRERVAEFDCRLPDIRADIENRHYITTSLLYVEPVLSSMRVIAIYLNIQTAFDLSLQFSP
jgi:hypothetical protein